MESTETTLSDDVLAYIGKPISVGPVHGWGWSAAQPRSFQMRLLELCRDPNGHIRGGLGRIETRGHAFDEHWVVFSLRHRGVWNFSTNRGHFDVCLYSERPNEFEAFATQGSFRSAPASSVTCGSAIIGVHDV